jgi:hypothetical protein
MLTALMAFTFTALFMAAIEHFHGQSIHGMRVNSTHGIHVHGTFYSSYRASIHGMCVLTALMAFTFPALFTAVLQDEHDG